MAITVGRSQETVPTLQEEGREVMLPVRRWTREEYHRAAEQGIFQPEERLELINGEIIEKMSPKNRPHALSVAVTAEALEAAFGPTCHAQREQPLTLPGESEPEPDIVMLPGKARDYSQHPTAADVLLILEISDTTYPTDARVKSSLYAAADISEYWLLNLNKRTLEVRREPYADPEALYKREYRSLVRYSEDETASPFAAPESAVLVRDLLPPILTTAREGSEKLIPEERS